jgi:hypothetical protein
MESGKAPIGTASYMAAFELLSIWLPHMKYA